MRKSRPIAFNVPCQSPAMSCARRALDDSVTTVTTMIHRMNFLFMCNLAFWMLTGLLLSRCWFFFKVSHKSQRGTCLEQLDDRSMAGCSGEASVARNQWSPKLFGKSNIGRVISRKIVAELPNPG